MSLVSTSKVEQALFFYINREFPDAISRYTTPDNIEIDIYIPSIKTGIEYDGYQWHKNKFEKDKEKNEYLLDQEIFILRIREKKLKPTCPKYGEEIILEHTIDVLKYDSMCVDAVMRVLSKRVKNQALRKRLSEYCLTEPEYIQNLPSFYSHIFDTKVDHNLTDFCGAELWDESNYPLMIENIPYNEWAYAKLKCKDNKIKMLPRYHRDCKSDCIADGYTCKKCVFGNSCQLLRWCKRKSPDEPIHCAYMEKYIHEIIEDDINITEWKSHNMLIQWLFRHSDIGIKIIKEILELPVDSNLRKKYYHFLHIEDDIGYGITTSTSYMVWNDEDKGIVERLAKQLQNTRLKALVCNISE